MTDRPMSVLQYVHRTEKLVSRSISVCEEQLAREADTLAFAAKIRQGLQEARLTLLRCKAMPD